MTKECHPRSLAQPNTLVWATINYLMKIIFTLSLHGTQLIIAIWVFLIKPLC